MPIENDVSQGTNRQFATIALSGINGVVRYDSGHPKRLHLYVTFEFSPKYARDSSIAELFMTSDWLDQANHPEGVLSIEGADMDALSDTAIGCLTLRGVTKPVPIRFGAEANFNRLKISGSLVFDRREFAIGKNYRAEIVSYGQRMIFGVVARPEVDDASDSFADRVEASCEGGQDAWGLLLSSPEYAVGGTAKKEVE